MIKLQKVNFKKTDEIEKIINLIYNTFCLCNKEESSEKLIKRYETLYGENKNLQNTITNFQKESEIFLIAKEWENIIWVIRWSNHKIINLYTDSWHQGKWIWKLLLNAFEIKAKKAWSKIIELKPSKFAYDFYIKHWFIKKNEKYLKKILD